MTTPYIDPQIIHNPAPGATAPASWGDTVRDDLEFLVTVPGVRCVANSGSIPNDSVTLVSWPAGLKVWDTDSFHSAGTPTRVTIPTGFGARYRIHAVVAFAPISSGNRAIALYSGGVLSRFGVYVSGAISSSCEIHDTLALTAGSYLEIGAYQNSGGALSILSASFVVEWAGRL